MQSSQRPEPERRVSLDVTEFLGCHYQTRCWRCHLYATMSVYVKVTMHHYLFDKTAKMSLLCLQEHTHDVDIWRFKCKEALVKQGDIILYLYFYLYLYLYLYLKTHYVGKWRFMCTGALVQGGENILMRRFYNVIVLFSFSQVLVEDISCCCWF